MPKKRAFEISPLPFEISTALECLGHRIAVARKERKQSQRVFTDVMGIAPATLVAIEGGAPSVQVGHYAQTLWVPPSPMDSSINDGIPVFRAITELPCQNSVTFYRQEGCYLLLTRKMC